MSKATRRASSDRLHGMSLEIVEECYRALRRAVELSEELALGTDVVVAACQKSPRSKVCRVQPDAWLVDTGSGHDLVDFGLVLDSAQLIEPANSNILLHTANGECRLDGSIRPALTMCCVKRDVTTGGLNQLCAVKNKGEVHKVVA